MWLVIAALRRPYTVWVGMLLVVVMGYISYNRTPTDILPHAQGARRGRLRLVPRHAGAGHGAERHLHPRAGLDRAATTSTTSSRARLLGIGIIQVYFRPQVDRATSPPARSSPWSTARCRICRPACCRPPSSSTTPAAIPVGNLVISSNTPRRQVSARPRRPRTARRTGRHRGAGRRPGLRRRLPPGADLRPSAHAGGAQACRRSTWPASSTRRATVIPTGEIRIGEQNYYVRSNAMVRQSRRTSTTSRSITMAARSSTSATSPTSSGRHALAHQHRPRRRPSAPSTCRCCARPAPAPSRVVDNVQDLLPELHERGVVPDDVHVEVAFDQSQYVRDALANLQPRSAARRRPRLAGRAALSRQLADRLDRRACPSRCRCWRRSSGCISPAKRSTS